MGNSKSFFEFEAVVSSWDILLKGFAVAMFAATLATALAIILGLVVALMRLSTVAIYRWIAFAFTQFFRGVPLYVLLVWVYFGLAIAVNINLSAILAGVITLALLNAGYLSETFRSGILAIDSGQIEAGLALGLSKQVVFKEIVLPQAFRIVIPPMGNQYVDAIKDSAILSIIGVPELMRESQQLANLYYQPFEFYTCAGLLYLIAVVLVSRGTNKLEKRFYTHSAQN